MRDTSTLIKNALSKKFTPGVKVHFVGIGGIGMCGLAELLHYSGSFVTGSDLVENIQTKRLKELGVFVSVGHRKENVKGAEILIQSSAVPENNIEIQTARELKLPVIRRIRGFGRNYEIEARSCSSWYTWKNHNHSFISTNFYS